VSTSNALLIDAFNRVHEVVHQAAEGLSPQDLSYRVAPETNTIGWLVWHLARVQDDHVASAAGSGQVWRQGGWAERFGLRFDDAATGYGQNSRQVGQVRVESADLLLGYFDAVQERTLAYLAGLGDDELARVVDESWDPPVTLAVRLVSIISDDLQHAGQAAFVAGIVRRQA
jgi:uncharacterized damage-inducible protein DinB